MMNNKTNNMNKPDKIYIQLSLKNEWFSEKATETDIEYIRFDLIKPILIAVSEKWGIDRVGEEKRQIGKEAINLLRKITNAKGEVY